MLGITMQSRPVQSIEESNEYFSEMVLSGREEEAIDLSHEYLSGNSFASLCDGPVRHCLEQVGHAWAQTSDGQEKNLASLKNTVPSTSFCRRCNNFAAWCSLPRHGRSRLVALRATLTWCSLCRTLALGRWLADGELGAKLPV